MITIQVATKKDFKQIWPIFNSIVSKGETYVYSPQTSYDEAYDIWMKRPLQTFVALKESSIVGTYYIKPNYSGLGNHICSCGYMVATNYRQQGIATAMCTHSFKQAKQLNFDAMQYNYVVSTNKASISLWKKMGFNIVGTVPNAFNHSLHGKIDTHIMYKIL